MTPMPSWPRRPRHWLPSLTLLAAACLPASHGVLASAPPAIEAELLSGARLWASKNRPDVARQLIRNRLNIVQRIVFHQLQHAKRCRIGFDKLHLIILIAIHQQASENFWR